MRPLPLRCRILWALGLGPFTVNDLSKALDSKPNHVHTVVIELAHLGVIRTERFKKDRGHKPSKVWEIAG